MYNFKVSASDMITGEARENLVRAMAAIGTRRDDANRQIDLACHAAAEAYNAAFRVIDSTASADRLQVMATAVEILSGSSAAMFGALMEKALKQRSEGDG